MYVRTLQNFTSAQLEHCFLDCHSIPASLTKCIQLVASVSTGGLESLSLPPCVNHPTRSQLKLWPTSSPASVSSSLCIQCLPLLELTALGSYKDSEHSAAVSALDLANDGCEEDQTVLPLLDLVQRHACGANISSGGRGEGKGGEWREGKRREGGGVTITQQPLEQ